MSNEISKEIAAALHLSENGVAGAVALFEKGATIPFIARYRKDQTGGLDEVQLLKIQTELERRTRLAERKNTMLATLESEGKITEALRSAILSADTLSSAEDLFLPYRKKRQSRAEKARQAGLEPLAKMIMVQKNRDPEQIARQFVKNDIPDIATALSGARDIMAEWMNENAALRKRLRQLFAKRAMVVTKVAQGKQDEGHQYSDYFDHKESITRIKPHRVLAILRGEKVGVLRVSCAPERTAALALIEKQFVKGKGADSDQVAAAAADAWTRLLRPALQNEALKALREEAEEAAIEVFANNLRQLLLAPPLGGKRVLAIDPGFRSGCKVVALDAAGGLLGHDTIYPHPPQKKTNAARNTLQTLVHAHQIEAIAIGNGTAGRETEALVRHTAFKRKLDVYMVNEDGASVYSASPIGRKEFPQYDVTIRGAVSIGRRLMDPLAELVKIDPRAIGVGQYQHDVNEVQLKRSLDQCVELVVNDVGVNLNTASPYLLKYVSGLGPRLAEQIVSHREASGAFGTRHELKDVKGLGEKAFELCAGFLRIPESEHALDNTAVHPESYTLVKRMARKMKLEVAELIENEAVLEQLDPAEWVDLSNGLLAVEGVITELKKPRRDPRKTAYTVEFDAKITRPEHLTIGQQMWGIVTNITHFGAFVDIGVKQDGLVHISELADRFVKDPFDIVRINQPVKVKVLEVDTTRKRISLSMKQADVLMPPV